MISKAGNTRRSFSVLVYFHRFTRNNRDLDAVYEHSIWSSVEVDECRANNNSVAELHKPRVKHGEGRKQVAAC